MSTGIRQFQLEGRSVLITGGSKGLGKSMALGLASAGASVAVTSRNLDQATEAVEEIVREYDVPVAAVEADVRDEASVDAMIREVLDHFGKIDVLINNAGINICGPIEELKYDEFRDVMATNVDGMWLCCRAAIKPMKEAGYGRIINLGSTLSTVGLEDRSAYATSKGAVIQLTRVLALELANDNILVNAICPGPFITEMNEPIADSEHAKKNIIGATALKRWGKLSEIQGAAIFLASDAANYMTGSFITVDGGWIAR